MVIRALNILCRYRTFNFVENTVFVFYVFVLNKKIYIKKKNNDFKRNREQKSNRYKINTHTFIRHMV